MDDTASPIQNESTFQLVHDEMGARVFTREREKVLVAVSLVRNQPTHLQLFSAAFNVTLLQRGSSPSALLLQRQEELRRKEQAHKPLDAAPRQ